ncbi:MAG: aminotransferase class V-fold PLP-dependent enzyme [Candidatus Lokiarchaeota archaeon]|nr:aminotransferase class V-fold PLP-dependent enzyme [Candidatus Lokiarchaeota archaeon]
MTIDWERIRQAEFPSISENKLIYLISAGASLMSKSAYDEGIRYFDQMQTNGDINHELLFLQVDEIRKSIGEYINADPDEIAFLINTTSGISASAYLFRKHIGEVLYPSIEFPTSIHMFRKLGYPCVEVDHEHGAYPIANFTAKLTENTKYSIQSHVQSFNGFRQNLYEYGNFCKEKEIINLINSTQAFGAFEIDVKAYNVDILVANALKWFGCGYGVGIIYIKNEIIQKFGLPFTGWLSVENPFAMDNENMDIVQKTSAMDSLGGCPNFASLLTLKGAFNLIKEKIGEGNLNKGIKLIQERIISLTSYFLEKLNTTPLSIITPQDIQYRSGIITVEHKKAKRIHRYLNKNNVYTTLKRYPEDSNETLIRFAINYYNNYGDLDSTIKIIKSCKYL